VTSRLLAWLPAGGSRRLAIQAGVAVVALLLLVVGGWAWYQARGAAGQAALGEALALALRAEAPTALAEERTRATKALETAIANHPGLPQTAHAAYRLGNLRWAAGQPGPARAAYEQALAKGATETVRRMAGVGIGYTWEAEKNYARAAQAYQTVVEGLGAQDFLFEEALLNLARAQEQAGNPTAAIGAYQRILKDVPDSRRADELRVRIAALRSRTKS